MILQGAEHLALMTFVFPGSLSGTSSRIAPTAGAVSVPQNTSARLLPSTSNTLAPISQDSTLVFSVPFDRAADFLWAVQEIPSRSPGSDEKSDVWIMKAGKVSGRGFASSLRRWASDSWNGFVDLIKVTLLY